MSDYQHHELRTHPEYLILLDAYQQREESLRGENPEFDGWQPRLRRIDGIDSELLSRFHGRLISLGYLEFQLGDRLEGIRYQLSTEAARALKQIDSDEPDPAEDSEAA